MPRLTVMPTVRCAEPDARRVAAPTHTSTSRGELVSSASSITARSAYRCDTTSVKAPLSLASVTQSSNVMPYAAP